MFTFISLLHLAICVALVFFILLQNPKGGALGVFGGQSSSKSVFASTGASQFLVNITKWCAIIFAFTSIQMAYMNSKKGSSVILDSPVVTQPLNPASSKSATKKPVKKNTKKP